MSVTWQCSVRLYESHCQEDKLKLDGNQFTSGGVCWDVWRWLQTGRGLLCSNHVKSSLNTRALDMHLSAREGWSVLFVFFTVTGQFVFVQVGHSNGNCSLLWWTRAAYANKTRDGREKQNNNRNESLTWQISYEESDPLGGQDKSGAKQCGSSSLFNTTLIAVSNKTGN